MLAYVKFNYLATKWCCRLFLFTCNKISFLLFLFSFLNTKVTLQDNMLSMVSFCKQSIVLFCFLCTRQSITELCAQPGSYYSSVWIKYIILNTVKSAVWWHGIQLHGHAANTTIHLQYQWHTVNMKDQQMHVKNVNNGQFNFGIFPFFLVLYISWLVFP